MLKPYIHQFEDYIKSEYNIKAIIAIDGSPSCGYNKTCSSKNWYGELSGCKNILETIEDVHMIDGRGIFIQELENLLKEYNLNIDIIGFEESKNIQFANMI